MEGKEGFSSDEEDWAQAIDSTPFQQSKVQQNHLRIETSKRQREDQIITQGCTQHSHTIIHIDIDCFYAQVEMIRNPDLRGKPLGIQQKNIIVTCNYEARARGVGKLMYLKDAKKACPELCIVNGEDLTHYREMSYKITATLSKFSSTVERLGFDENFIDVSGIVGVPPWTESPVKPEGFVYGVKGDDLENLPNRGCSCGCERRLTIASHIAAEMRHTLFSELGITCCAGVAHNKLLAKLVGGTHKPNQQTLMYPQSVPELMATIPTLRKIPGLGHKTCERLGSLGVTSVSDLQNVSLITLQQEFGPETAKTLQNLSHGIDESKVVKTGQPQSISDEDSFRKCDTMNDVKSKLSELLDNVLHRLDMDGRTPQTLRICVRKHAPGVKYSNRQSRQAPIPPAVMRKGTDKKARLLDLSLQLFEKLVDTTLTFHLTLLSVCLTNFLPTSGRTNAQIQHFFTSPPKSKPDLGIKNVDKTRLSENNQGQTDVDKTGFSQKKKGQTDVDKTWLRRNKQGQTDVDNTRPSQNKLGQIDVDKAGLSRNKLGQTDVDKAGLSRNKLGQTDVDKTGCSMSVTTQECSIEAGNLLKQMCSNKASEGSVKVEMGQSSVNPSSKCSLTQACGSKVSEGSTESAKIEMGQSSVTQLSQISPSQALSEYNHGASKDVAVGNNAVLASKEGVQVEMGQRSLSEMSQFSPSHALGKCDGITSEGISVMNSAGVLSLPEHSNLANIKGQKCYNESRQELCKELVTFHSSKVPQTSDLVADKDKFVSNKHLDSHNGENDKLKLDSNKNCLVDSSERISFLRRHLGPDTNVEVFMELPLDIQKEIVQSQMPSKMQAEIKEILTVLQSLSRNHETNVDSVRNPGKSTLNVSVSSEICVTQPGKCTSEEVTSCSDSISDRQRCSDNVNRMISHCDSINNTSRHYDSNRDDTMYTDISENMSKYDDHSRLNIESCIRKSNQAPSSLEESHIHAVETKTCQPGKFEENPSVSQCSNDIGQVENASKEHKLSPGKHRVEGSCVNVVIPPGYDESVFRELPSHIQKSLVSEYKTTSEFQSMKKRKLSSSSPGNSKTQVKKRYSGGDITAFFRKR